MNRGMKDQIFGIAITILACVVFVASFYIRTMLPMKPGPEFMPQVASIFLFIIGIIIFIQGSLVSIKIKSEPVDTMKDKAKQDDGGMRNVLMSAALLGVYVYTLELVGFLITTTLYIFFQSLILAEDKKRKTMGLILLVSVSVSVITYFMFTRVLYLMLPPGLLGI